MSHYGSSQYMCAGTDLTLSTLVCYSWPLCLSHLLPWKLSYCDDIWRMNVTQSNPVHPAEHTRFTAGQTILTVSTHVIAGMLLLTYSAEQYYIISHWRILDLHPYPSKQALLVSESIVLDQRSVIISSPASSIIIWWITECLHVHLLTYRIISLHHKHLFL